MSQEGLLRAFVTPQASLAVCFQLIGEMINKFAVDNKISGVPEGPSCPWGMRRGHSTSVTQKWNG